ncbi:hypothetical protein FHT98_3106 [Bosea sp. AK1]|uniref:hypothetical protein n=1 Tax=Bosea sp. AK1 TaxID=2587160 RepID=UPI0011505C0A|nr:hypothetical protein [Bosea sp. AK1]TQI75327.1 hypothetical protein FHT98_3106 [Bosea sp. AK1]
MSMKLTRQAGAQAVRMIELARLAPREIAVLGCISGASPIVLCKRSARALRTHVKRADRIGIPQMVLAFEHELRRALRGATSEAEEFALALLAAHCVIHGWRIADARPDERTGIVICLAEHAGHGVQQILLARGIGGELPRLVSLPLNRGDQP